MMVIRQIVLLSTRYWQSVLLRFHPDGVVNLFA